MTEKRYNCKKTSQGAPETDCVEPINGSGALGQQTVPGDGRNRRLIGIAPEGMPIIAGLAFVTLYLGALGFGAAALFFLIATVFTVFFFRDPDRLIPAQPGVVVSPADGKIVCVETGLCPFTSEQALKISVFMSVFNVHVNRIPDDATVVDVQYHPGCFFSANLDKASRDNEHNAVVLKLHDGRCMVVVQIAGLIARRIVCRIHPGERLSRGQRFGIICFGSRVDLYLPTDTKPAVCVGDKVLAGLSIVGHLS
ncbi:MAG: phosphatidylserine decarboxylase family protein [Deltaproteobacteria bacterium]|nr:phosphatidylserine decarboxylase family protein [Deltaproteobacteria bacterium]